MSPCWTVCAGTAANFFKTSVEATGEYVEKVSTLQHPAPSTQQPHIQPGSACLHTLFAGTRSSSFK